MEVGFLGLNRIQAVQVEAFFGSVLVLWATVSLGWSDTDLRWTGLYSLALIGAYLIGRLAPTRPIWQGLCGLACFTIAIWPWWGGYSLFGNPNVMGVALALTFAAALAYRLYWAMPFALVGLAVCQSRGALIGAAVALCCWLWRVERWTVIVVIGLVFVAVHEIPRHSDASSMSRLGIWHDTMMNFIPLGHGWGSFYETFWKIPVHMNIEAARPSHAYNDWLELMFDLGIGIIPVIFLVTFGLETSDWRAQLVLITFLACGLTFYPLFLPVLGQVGTFALGAAIRSRYHGKMAFSRTALSIHPRVGMGIQRGR